MRRLHKAENSIRKTAGSPDRFIGYEPEMEREKYRGSHQRMMTAPLRVFTDKFVTASDQADPE